MRFFSRRGRSRSVDRAAKNKTNRQHEHPATHNITDKCNNNECDDSVGSELPTLDQFEIAVPSKSFASTSQGDRKYPESREDDGDNRSATDMSSITSVSYRAGYYYLRNVKKRSPEKKSKESGCLPSCCCSACMPCSCSWLTCCCCSEAKSELATAGTVVSKNSLLAHPPPREKARKAQSAGGRRAVAPPSDGHPQSRNYNNIQNQGVSTPHQRGRNSGRRYNASERDRATPLHGGGDDRIHPHIQRNHSLFDELSEEEDANGGYGRGRRQQPALMHNQQEQQQYSHRLLKNKTWLTRRTGHPSGPEYNNSSNGREKTSRGRPRQRGRRGEQWY